MTASFRTWVAALGLGLAAALLVPGYAAAHFVLQSPASWREQNVLGDPQKIGPCGEEGTAPTTGIVTPFAPGQTITIVLDEAIFHPGNYRVALSVNDRSELPAEPPVTPGATACGSVPIMSPAVLPVLADGMLPHTEPFPGTQSFQVTLPSDVTCTRCTLQVLEFMSNHAAPCFYHHCADLSIMASEPCATDAECADGDACALGVCDPEEGCVTRPADLTDLGARVAGILSVPACAAEQMPRRIRRLAGRAEALVARAMERPGNKARRLVRRAGKRLDRAAKKVTKLQGRKLSTECAAALGAALGDARTLIECLALP